MNLLTDEEIKAAYRSCKAGDFIKSFNGFVVEKAIAKAQDAKTLRAVGEWLEKNALDLEMGLVIPDWNGECKLRDKFIEALKSGHLPEE